MQTSDQVQNLVSIIALKNLARDKPPASSALRDLIPSELDYLPSEEVMIKVGPKRPLLGWLLLRWTGRWLIDLFVNCVREVVPSYDHPHVLYAVHLQQV